MTIPSAYIIPTSVASTDFVHHDSKRTIDWFVIPFLQFRTKDTLQFEAEETLSEKMNSDIAC